jgi:hypothetical protein
MKWQAEERGSVRLGGTRILLVLQVAVHFQGSTGLPAARLLSVCVMAALASMCF